MTEGLRLTSEERLALREWWDVGPGWADQDDPLTRLQRIVADLVSARLAKVEAVCAAWDAEPSLPPSTYNLVDDVRAALRFPPGVPRGSDE